MPLYHVRTNKSGHIQPDISMDCPTRDAAWAELALICSDLIGDVARTLQQDGDWQIELLDDALTPIGRIRVVAERVD